MASIFQFDDVDTTKPPKGKPAYNDHVAVVAMGESVNGKVSMLDGWKIATGDQEVANALSQLFGAAPVELETTKEEFIALYTDREELPVVVAPGDISADYKLWINGQLMHHCDGVKHLSDTRDGNTGEACHCPTTLAEKKERARLMVGPKPSIDVRFRFADDYELGRAKWHTGSWGFARDMYQVEGALADGSEQLFTLSMNHVSFVAKNGPMKGKTVSFTEPKMSHVKSWNDAVADAPGEA